MLVIGTCISSAVVFHVEKETEKLMLPYLRNLSDALTGYKAPAITLLYTGSDISFENTVSEEYLFSGNFIFQSVEPEKRIEAMVKYKSSLLSSIEFQNVTV